MTISRLRASRPILAALATLALSACSTAMVSQPGVSGREKGDTSMSCCTNMKGQSQAGDKKSGCCCSSMMDGKDGCPCCGGSDGKPMMCQPKN